jgi:ankyrin repeat protein
MSRAQDNVAKPICLWAAFGITGVAVWLMVYLISPPREDCPANCQLNSAASAGDLTELRKVLQDHHELSTSDRSAALRLATMYGQEAVVNELLLNGADVNASDPNGNTALFSTAIPWEGGDGLARRLLEAGAWIDARDKGGRTPLIDAAENGKLAVVDVLLRSGADQTIADWHGQTALDVAREKRHQLIVLRLVRCEK